eukprot:m.236708 g.236708  ORF g.236708 m.236708 type:complete len:444 (+) comp15264_c0_seq12:4869-6200(+)
MSPQQGQLRNMLDPETIVWVNGEAYDGAAFARNHPGGETFVSLYGGRDATDAFATYHRRAFPFKLMEQYRIEDKQLSAEHVFGTSSPKVADAQYLELAKEVNAFLNTRVKGGFAPSWYFLKVAFLLCGVIFFEWMMVYRDQPSMVAGALCGLFMAWIGLNIQHDANHGAVSRNPLVNEVLGFTQDWIGGNSLLWLQEHVAIHHIECNDLEYDKDMMENPLIRFSVYSKRWLWQRLQSVYVLAVECGYAMKVIFFDWYNLLTNQYEGVKISKLVPSWRWYASVAAKVFWLTRFVLIPFYFHGVAFAPSFIAMMAVGGFYLAFFFLLSHNFEQVYHIVNGKLVPATDHANTDRIRENTLVNRQVLTSSNVGGPILAMFNGGLNYQIEHHLFPRVSHCHYAAISPIVRRFCEKNDIPYVHFPTVTENLWSMLRFFDIQGRAEHVAI